MSRLLLVLVAPVIAMSWTVTKASAQPTPEDVEAFCSEDSASPACRAVMLRFCAHNPDEPVCASDDEDEED